MQDTFLRRVVDRSPSELVGDGQLLVRHLFPRLYVEVDVGSDLMARLAPLFDANLCRRLSVVRRLEDVQILTEPIRTRIDITSTFCLSSISRLFHFTRQLCMGKLLILYLLFSYVYVMFMNEFLCFRL